MQSNHPTNMTCRCRCFDLTLSAVLTRYHFDPCTRWVHGRRIHVHENDFEPSMIYGNLSTSGVNINKISIKIEVWPNRSDWQRIPSRRARNSKTLMTITVHSVPRNNHLPLTGWPHVLTDMVFCLCAVTLNAESLESAKPSPMQYSNSATLHRIWAHMRWSVG